MADNKTAIQDQKGTVPTVNPIASVAKESTVAEVVQRSDTKWDAISKARLIPQEIICEGYHPLHPHNAGCHSRLRLTSKSILDHVNADHGNKNGVGFSIQLRESDGRVWNGWEEMSVAGLEAFDARCDVCDEQAKFQPQWFLKHIKPHAGKSKRPKANKVFWFTINSQYKELPQEDDEFFQDAE